MEKPTVFGYICDQPRALRECFAHREQFCAPFAEIFKKHPIKKVYLLGSGTSYNASLVGKTYFSELLGVEVEVCIPTVFTNYVKVNINGIYKKDEILIVAISQTGTSISTINALKKAYEEGWQTAVLTEDLNSPITRYARQIIRLLCGEEDVMVETKGYTVTVLTLYLWALETARALAKLEKDSYEKLLCQLQDVLAQMPKIVESSIAWYEKHKQEMLSMELGVVAGYGINHATAIEAALKVGETFRRPFQAYELEEFMHGPDMALNNQEFIYLICSDEREKERMLQFREFFLTVTSHVFVITSEEGPWGEKDLLLPCKTSKNLSVLFYSVPLQVLAALSSRDSGIDTAVYPFESNDLAHCASNQEEKG